MRLPNFTVRKTGSRKDQEWLADSRNLFSSSSAMLQAYQATMIMQVNSSCCLLLVLPAVVVDSLLIMCKCLIEESELEASARFVKSVLRVVTEFLIYC